MYYYGINRYNHRHIIRSKKKWHGKLNKEVISVEVWSIHTAVWYQGNEAFRPFGIAYRIPNTLALLLQAQTPESKP